MRWYLIPVVVLLMLLGTSHRSSCQDAGTLQLTIIDERQTATLDFSDGPRSIQIAPGFRYTLRCSRENGFGSTRAWRDGDGVIEEQEGSNPSITSFNTNIRDLIFDPFLTTHAGQYSCQFNEEIISLTIGAGNPALIATIPCITLRGGPQVDNRPTGVIFISGNPFPTEEQTRWEFNGSPITVQGFRDIGVTVLGPGDLLFSRTIEREIEGRYFFTVSTSMGSVNASFDVKVLFDPAVEISPGESATLAVGDSINVTCEDSTGNPPPTFSWRFNSTVLEPGGNVEITNTSNSTRQATMLSLTSVQREDGGLYECIARNNPDPNRYNGRQIQITVLSPPVPPTDIVVETISSCQVRIGWTIVNRTNFMPANSFVIEIQFPGNESDSVWEELGRTPSPPLDAAIPFRGINARYNLRGRGVNDEIGGGDNSMAYGTFESHPEDQLPRIEGTTAQPSGSNAITVEWDFPASLCYTPSFRASCVVTTAATTTATTTTTTTVNSSSEDIRMVVVRGLESQQRYNCHLTVTLTTSSFISNSSVVVDESDSDPILTYTFPPAPPPPTLPQLDRGSVTANAFTVTFEPLPPEENISHYQILVLRLTSDVLPTSHPDTLYPTNASFSTCQKVNDPNNQDMTFDPYVAMEISAAEFDGQFIVGGGEDSSSDDDTRCNSMLLSGVMYSVFLRAYPEGGPPDSSDGGRMKRQQTGGNEKQYVVFTSSQFLPATSTSDLTDTPESQDTVIIIIVVVVILLLVTLTIIMAVVVFLIYKRTRTKSVFMPKVDQSMDSSMDDLSAMGPDTPDLGRRNNGIELKAIEAFSDPMDAFQPSGPIAVEDFRHHVEKFDAKRQLLFQEEFEWISKNSPWHAAEASQDPRNDFKNRYSNVTAFDHSRVKLTPIPGVECSDYINANYITGYNKQQEYIATQGPLEQTVEDFWRLVWEQRSSTIIMLTNIVELGKIKCSQYWPNSNKTMYGDIAVTLENVLTLPDYTIRTFGVQLITTSEYRRVLQFHYTKWPDYGTPKLAAPLLNFLKTVHETNDAEVNAGPIVIHCSAGVGRSGTVMTIDYCLQQLRAEHIINVCGYIRSMREQRNYLVQTDQQYTFIHYAILEAITYGDTSYDVAKFLDFYETGTEVLKVEYSRLGTVKTMAKKSSFQNRIMCKGAPQRHFHSSFHGGSTSSSIQQCLGHFLDGYNHTRMFVVVKGADENTVARFWEMVWDHNCRYIIMLTPMDAEEYFPYWPRNPDEDIRFGSINVMLENESEEHFYTVRRIHLTNTKVEGISHEVMQYQFIGWTSKLLPTVPDFVSFICDLLKKVDTTSEEYQNKRVLVHDLDSLGPTGIFCALYYCIQRLQTEKIVDVFQSVQMIQLQRPACVDNVEEYAFIYDCVYEFLKRNS